MKLTKDNVKLGQNLYRSTDGAKCPIVEIDDNDADVPVRVQTPDDGIRWVESNGKALCIEAYFLPYVAPIETIIERLQSHDWDQDPEDRLRRVWAIVGGSTE